MKEVFKYELMIVINGNAKIRVHFSDGGNKVLTIPPELLASYETVLKQPHVGFDPVNNFFITRSQFDNRELRGF